MRWNVAPCFARTPNEFVLFIRSVSLLWQAFIYLSLMNRISVAGTAVMAGVTCYMFLAYPWLPVPGKQCQQQKIDRHR